MTPTPDPTVLQGRPVGEDDPITVTVSGGRITDVVAGGDDRFVLAPGLVDLHCHGGGGHEFGLGDTRTAADAHHRRGTTTVVASLVSARPDDLATRVATLADHVDGPATDGPATDAIAGIHLEGPFLARPQCGAHDPDALHDPDPALLDRLVEVGGGGVRMVTLAPELAGADALVDRALDHGLLVAIGHSDAPADLVADVAEQVRRRTPTARMVATHLYNGMPTVDHRDPGPVLAALAAAARGLARVELIADGVHLAPATIAATFDLVGDAVVLISDATAATGAGDGHHRLGDLEVRVHGRVCELVHGNSLAGSVTPLLDMVRTAIDAGVDPAAAMAAATRTPADTLARPDLGRLEVGTRADVLVLDDDWDLHQVWRAGRRLEPAASA